MFTDAQLTEEYFDIMRSLGGDVAGRKEAHAYMARSTAIVHHRVVECTFVPRLFNDQVWDAFRSTAETTHRILCKVMQAYLDDPNYRQAFSFDPRLEELILIPRRYDALLPFARIDVFTDEDTLECAFCEFNGDGSAGMNENREITNSIRDCASLRMFGQRHRFEECELFESWVDEFISIYDTFENRVDNPRFAICDYLDRGVVNEFAMFARLFKQRGYECTVCDVRSLRFDGTRLRDADGNPVDAIWRRAVTNDVLEFWDESQQLIEAYRAGAVALIGSFAGHIVHDKQVFEALRHPLTQAFLTPEENAFVEAHVPQTRFLDDSDVDLAAVRANKDRWIIKPTDAYGAQDVYAGVGHTQREWDELIDRFANGACGHPFLVQAYITPYRTDTLPPDEGIEGLLAEEVSCTPVPYNNLNGLYLYNGRFQGVFSRLGPQPTISKDCEGITAATIHVLD